MSPIHDKEKWKHTSLVCIEVTKKDNMKPARAYLVPGNGAAGSMGL